MGHMGLMGPVRSKGLSLERCPACEADRSEPLERCLACEADSVGTRGTRLAREAMVNEVKSRSIPFPPCVC